MKKLSSLLMLLCVFTLSINQVYAQADTEPDTGSNTQQVDSLPVNEPDTSDKDTSGAATKKADKSESGHQVLKTKFIEGTPGFMALPLLCLILGLAIAIERIISLFWMSINTDKFVDQIDAAVTGGNGNLEQAKEICRNTRGPVASIFYQGLERADHESIDVVEKAIVNYGSVQTGQMEKGLVWLSLFIALAPMLGFLGTVIGMIDAFDAIEKAGDISAGVVARGIKVALLTTVAGLIVAIILQLFYNYVVSKIDSLVNRMEDASITLVDILVRNDIVRHQ
jgi:biopolymer transport protein ExbB